MEKRIDESNNLVINQREGVCGVFWWWVMVVNDVLRDVKWVWKRNYEGNLGFSTVS